jgi:hypothetical protein
MSSEDLQQGARANADRAAVDQPRGARGRAGLIRAAMEDINPWRGVIWQGITFWLATRAALITFTWAAIMLLLVINVSHPVNDTSYEPWLLIKGWAGWDGHYYEQIAASGYAHQIPQDYPRAAFLPFYPLLVAGFSAVFSLPHLTEVPQLWGGLAASSFSSLVAFVGIAALARREFGTSGDSWRAMALTAAYPFAFFLAAVYPQATLLAAATLALLFARSGRWLAAATAAYVAGLTHQAGLVLVLPLAWEYAHQHRWLPQPTPVHAVGRSVTAMRVARGLLVVCAAPLGLLTFMGYLWRTFGNPLFFQEVQHAYWWRELTGPWTTVQLVASSLQKSPRLGYDELTILIDGGLWVGVAGVTILLARRQPVSFTLYMAALLLFCVIAPTVSPYIPNPISGTGRFLTAAVPLFVGLAGVLRRDSSMGFTALIGGGVMLQGILAAYFLAGGFVG